MGKTSITRKSFIGHATRTWNRALDEIKLTKTMFSVKQELRSTAKCYQCDEKM